MSAITIDSLKEKYLITVDKDSIDADTLFSILKTFRVEHLAQKSNIGDEIFEIGEKIKQDWWEKNQFRFVENR
ncbi:MAG: hypothetical protein MUE30_05580 [Spirosomaceae bacterium]|jgi:hypothetical protein|nr:hypothetical protein [Spirosomataceae bacterium]